MYNLLLLIRLLFSSPWKWDRPDQNFVWIILHSKKTGISIYVENIVIVI